MFDLEYPENLKFTQLFSINGNPDDVFKGIKYDWEDVSKIGISGKYEGTMQMITSTYSEPEATTDNYTVTELKKSNKITYWVHKELFYLLTFIELPISCAINLPFQTDLFRNQDEYPETTCMSGLFYKCFSSTKSKESSIRFIRKSYLRYVSQRYVSDCGICDGINVPSYTRQPKTEIVNTIKVYNVNSIPNAYSKFIEGLSSYGNWTVSKVFPNKNEYVIPDYKILTPSPKYKSFRNRTQSYKDWVAKHGSDNGYEYRQEASLDILHSLAATLANKNTLSVTFNGKHIDSLEGTVLANQNDRFPDLQSMFVSASIPLINNAICSVKNEYGHIFNFNDFVQTDMTISVDYSVDKVINGNLFSNANVPEGQLSSSVKIRESFNASNIVPFDYTKFIEEHSPDEYLKKLIEYDSSVNSSSKFNEAMKNLSSANPLSSAIVALNTSVFTSLMNYKYIFRMLACELYMSYFKYLSNKQLKVITTNYQNAELYDNDNNPLLNRVYDIPSMQWISNSAVKLATKVLKEQIIPTIIKSWSEKINSNNKIKQAYIRNKYLKECELKMPNVNVLEEYPIISLIGVFDNVSYSTKIVDDIVRHYVSKKITLAEYKQLHGHSSGTVHEHSSGTVKTTSGVISKHSANTLDKYIWTEPIETNEDNSIYWFNENLHEYWLEWCRHGHMQISIPNVLQSIEVFKTNQALIHLSFPYSVEEVDPNSIQIINSDNDLKTSSEFDELTNIIVKSIDMSTGEILDKTVKIYVPRAYANKIVIKHNSIIIPFYLEGSATIPNKLLNATF